MAPPTIPPSGTFPRRAFVRGLGALVALPFFESLVSGQALRAAERIAAASGPGAAGAAGPFPLRTAFVYIPNGVDNANWWPTGEGADYTFGSSLAPMEPFRADLQVIAGLAHNKANGNGDGAGDHARASATFLTGVQARKTSGRDIHLGQSVNQAIAKKVGANYNLPSLQLSCEGPRLTGDCDSGYSCAYQYNLSWTSDTQPLPAERNPRLVFERMFGSAASSGSGAGAARLRADRQSILDFVRADARQLQGRLGRADQQKLDEYFTSVREIEQRLNAFDKVTAALPPGTKAPTGVLPDYEEHIRLTCDLLVLAFQTNSTPVASLLLAHEGSNRPFPNLDITEGHHDLSHNRGAEAKLAQIRKIDAFYARQFAYLLGRMKAIKEGDRTLLDNCLVLYGSGIRDGDKHTHVDLPVILAGRAGGAISTGYVNQLSQPAPMTNLFLTLMDLHGAPADRLGDSTGRLALA